MVDKWPSNRPRKDGDEKSIVQLPVGRNVATRRVHKKAICCKAWNKIVDGSATPPTANSNPIEALMSPGDERRVLVQASTPGLPAMPDTMNCRAGRERSVRAAEIASP